MRPPSPLSRLLRVVPSPTSWWGAARFVLAFAAALGAAWLFVHNGSTAERVSRYVQADRQAQQQLEGWAPAIWGPAFMQEEGGSGDGSGGDGSFDPEHFYGASGAQPTYDSSTELRWESLNFLIDALDPAQESGALYPLRRALEQLAGYLILPLILLSVLHALVTRGGAADQQLVKIGVNFFTVIFLLFSYPYWDALLFKGMAIPITEELTQGQVFHDVTASVGSHSPDGGDFAQGAAENTDLINGVLGHHQTTLHCQTAISTGGPESDPEALREACDRGWRGGNVMQAQEIQSMTGQQDEEVQQSAVETIVSGFTNPALWQTLGVVVPGAGAGAPVVEAGKAASDIAKKLSVDNFLNWLGETLTGWMTSLVHIIASAILWFVWLGVIVARTMSLAFAPIAIVWGLVPNGMSKAKKWFMGHAKIVFMPVGLAFGMLVYWALFTAVMGADIVRWGDAGAAGVGAFLAGIGIKIGLLIALIALLWQGKSLMDFAAGDVTKVASDFGKAARSRTVQVAGSVVTGSAAVATAGASGALTAGAAGAGKAGMMKSAAQKMGGKAFGEAASKVGDAMSKDFDAEDTEMGGGESFLSRAGRAARDGVGMGARVVSTAFEGRMDYDDAQSVGGALRGGVLEPFQQLRSAMKENVEEERASRRAFLAEEQAERVAEMREGQQLRQDLREQLGLGAIEERQGDNIQISGENVQIHGLDEADLQAGNALGARMARLADAEGLPLNVDVDEQDPMGGLRLDNASAQALTRRMETDPEFMEAVMQEARRTFGDDVPMVEGARGPVPDLQKLMRKSTAFANGAAAAAQALETKKQEIHRRDVLSALAKTKEGALDDRAVRQLHTDVADRFPDETDEMYGKRLRSEAERVARRAWYLGATPEERQAQGLPAEGGADEAARTPIEIEQEFFKPGGFEKMPASMRNSFSTAVRQHRQSVESKRGQQHVVNGQRYGLDFGGWVRSEGQKHSYEFDPDTSVMAEVLKDNPELKNRMDKAYKEALNRAVERSEVPDQRPGESREAYLDRVRTTAHDFVFLNREAAQARNS